ncbi:unnamed protein product [Soboliphyme baturini]|uniref:Uncharacterized protein n=1 Tax=Soboliphyme baturini TaxID=241478 RepID=A0A183IL15_9BILA|nr:unnamed protein product [Soboliphyme baturini]
MSDSVGQRSTTDERTMNSLGLSFCRPFICCYLTSIAARLRRPHLRRQIAESIIRTFLIFLKRKAHQTALTRWPTVTMDISYHVSAYQRRRRRPSACARRKEEPEAQIESNPDYLAAPPSSVAFDLGHSSDSGHWSLGHRHDYPPTDQQTDRRGPSVRSANDRQKTWRSIGRRYDCLRFVIVATVKIISPLTTGHFERLPVVTSGP